MAEIAPFRAWRYDFPRIGENLSSRVAPPYDVLDQQGKERLLAKSDRNVVAIDLPYAPAKALGPPECYEAAARTFENWQADGTLVQEDSPAVYIYHQLFEHDGRTYTRRMFIARLKLEPFSAGIVLPHEETFGGPKEDRLALMKATRANLSSVFGLYRDPEDDLASIFTSHIDRSPDAQTTLDGVQNRIWIMTAGDAVDRLVRTFADKQVYIADGHHRYNTALTYRDWLAGENGGELPANHPANYIMLVFGCMEDPGSLILPTHRVLVETGDLGLAALMDAWSSGCAESSPDVADMTLHHGASGEAKHVRFTNRSVLSTLEPKLSPAWCALDSAYLHRYLIDELYTRVPGRRDAPIIRYAKSESEARRIAETERGIALICEPATMAQLREVSQAGNLMPQKSTYFHPKVLTGLTINPLH